MELSQKNELPKPVLFLSFLTPILISIWVVHYQAHHIPPTPNFDISGERIPRLSELIPWLPLASGICLLLYSFLNFELKKNRSFFIVYSLFLAVILVLEFIFVPRL